MKRTKPNKAAKAFADLERCERRLATAFTKWTKARARVRRIESKMDREHAEKLPGEMDVRRMPIQVKPWPSEKRANK